MTTWAGRFPHTTPASILGALWLRQAGRSWILQSS